MEMKRLTNLCSPQGFTSRLIVSVSLGVFAIPLTYGQDQSDLNSPVTITHSQSNKIPAADVSPEAPTQEMEYTETPENGWNDDPDVDRISTTRFEQVDMDYDHCHYDEAHQHQHCYDANEHDHELELEQSDHIYVTESSVYPRRVYTNYTTVRNTNRYYRSPDHYRSRGDNLGAVAIGLAIGLPLAYSHHYYDRGYSRHMGYGSRGYSSRGYGKRGYGNRSYNRDQRGRSYGQHRGGRH